MQARAESAADNEKDEIRSYAEDQLGEEVVHVEKVGSELVGSQRHDIWDVHCADSRWWVLTNPTHYYSQEDFKSRDVVLTFHVGLMIRVWSQQERQVPVAPEPAATLPGSWRRWQQAFEAYDGGDEAENFQSVGMRLRECLLSFLDEACGDELAPEGAASPKRGDFKNWTDLLANAVAPGASAARLRSYLKKMSGETWEYVNWLTHAKNAIRMDAEIGLKMVEHLLACFTAAQMRLSRASTRCEECESYRVVAGSCGVCGWNDPEYEPVEVSHLTEDEIAERLAEPCTPSSDISTFSHRTISGNRRIGPGLEGGEGRRSAVPACQRPLRHDSRRCQLFDWEPLRPGCSALQRVTSSPYFTALSHPGQLAGPSRRRLEDGSLDRKENRASSRSWRSSWRACARTDPFATQVPDGLAQVTPRAWSARGSGGGGGGAALSLYAFSVPQPQV